MKKTSGLKGAMSWNYYSCWCYYYYFIYNYFSSYNFCLQTSYCRYVIDNAFLCLRPPRLVTNRPSSKCLSFALNVFAKAIAVSYPSQKLCFPWSLRYAIIWSFIVRYCLKDRISALVPRPLLLLRICIHHITNATTWYICRYSLVLFYRMSMDDHTL